ncbi:MAG: ATP-binding cassette domain-containing protein [Neisseriaceae bacterium]
MNDLAIIECINVGRAYQDGALAVEVVKAVNLKIYREQSIAILGASGSGKSTLLQLMGGLDLPTSGTIRLMGKDLKKFSVTELGLWRNQHLGFVYQFHHLLPEFTSLENVMMPLLIAKIQPKVAQKKAREILESVNLGHRMDHRPVELSGGERQRVAIARAIANDPTCILLDEPTGNLDKRNAQQVIQLLGNLKLQFKLAFLVVTHDESLVTYFDQVLAMSDGELSTC